MLTRMNILIACITGENSTFDECGWMGCESFLTGGSVPEERSVYPI